MSLENIKGIYKEYFLYHQKYGGIKKTLVLMQIGLFYKAFSMDTLGYINLLEISKLLGIKIGNTPRKTSINSYSTIGFPKTSLDKFLNKLVNAGYIVVIIDQITDAPCPRREMTCTY